MNLTAVAPIGVDADNQRIRQVQQGRKRRFREFFLSEGQLVEIEDLIPLFKTPSQPPSVEVLLALKSDFSEAALRELAKTTTKDLDAGLCKLKESITEETLDNNFRSE